MAVTMKDPRTFFVQGSVVQYEFVLGLYEEALKLKAKQKNKNSEDFLKLDRWYQNELPRKIKSRGKEAHLTHEELVKCMKWKLYRCKYSPRLNDLIQMNTPRVCMAETKKAFRALSKKEDLSSAIQALCNLKGVGPAMASAVLTAANPNMCGFMADECLLAIPEIETIDYTTKELLHFVSQLKTAAGRLNKESGNSIQWSPHKVEQALWAHFIVTDLNKELLNDMPESTNVLPQTPAENGATTEETSSEKKNGNFLNDENADSMDSLANKENQTSNLDTKGTTNGISDPEDSSSSSRDFLACEDTTNDSMATSDVPSETISETLSSDAQTTDEPSAKKLKVDYQEEQEQQQQPPQ